MNMLKKITSLFSDTGDGKQMFKSPKGAAAIKSGQPPLNLLLVWLDTNIGLVNNSDCYKTIVELRQVANSIKTFTDSDQCIDFITDIDNEKIFMIISGTLGETLVPIIHDLCQISVIYIFCRDEIKHKQWAQNWCKIKGVFVEISAIRRELEQTVQECESNAIPISFVSTNEKLSNQSLDQIDQSFIYTQILKEILLTIEFDNQSITDFIIYCRELFADNSIELDNVNKFEKEYRDHNPIWWYTYECFLYSLLNQALRTMEVGIILKMGFFVQDLHQNIVKLHMEQYSGHRQWYSFTVYRGQGLSESNFNQLMKTEGGLLSFNTFLSTSKKQNIAINFALRSLAKSDVVGIVFVMTINPSSSSTPFAATKNVSYYQTEREILFSMHSVFRIGHIKQIDHDKNRLWQVELTLTSDDDPQRRDITERIRKETPGLTGWHRLGQFLIMIGQFTKAEDLYNVLLHKTHDKYEKAQVNHHLGVIMDGKGDYERAIKFYEKSLEINTEILTPDHHYLGSTYSGLGLVYFRKGDYSKALLFHKKALEIFRKTLSSTNSHTAICYGNIGKVYEELGELPRALVSHENALAIFQKNLPPIHPRMAICYYDIGKVYDKMGEFSEALSYHERALAIRIKILPPDHPFLPASYNSMGELHIKMGKYSKGLAYIKHAIDLGRRSLPPNHPDLELYINSYKSFQTKIYTILDKVKF